MKTIGVDVGGTKILCRLFDSETGKATGRTKARTPKTGPDDVLAAVVDLIAKLDPDNEAVAIGVGFPGYVRPDGVVVQCTNISGWDHPLDVAPVLQEAAGRPVVVGNDVSLGALAEHRVGAGQGERDLLAVFVGTGVGGGLILDGQIRAGERGLAGEIGHLTVKADGRLCGCGARGHLEAYAGKAGIEREARRLAATGETSFLMDMVQNGSMKSRHVNLALEAKDPVTVRLMEEAVDALAQSIGNVATILDINRIVLGGGMTDKFGQDFIDQIVASSSFGGFGPGRLELRLAERMDDAGAVGAALLAADSLARS